MCLKTIKVLLLIISIGGFLHDLPAKALEPMDATSDEYLINHGHSPEIVRLINLQKERTEGKGVTHTVSEGKVKKFFKNIWFEQDLTMPLNDFGYNEVKTVETNQSEVIPKIDKTYNDIKNWGKTPKDELKIREEE